VTGSEKLCLSEWQALALTDNAKLTHQDLHLQCYFCRVTIQRITGGFVLAAAMAAAAKNINFLWVSMWFLFALGVPKSGKPKS